MGCVVAIPRCGDGRSSKSRNRSLTNTSSAASAKRGNDDDGATTIQQSYATTVDDIKPASSSSFVENAAGNEPRRRTSYGGRGGGHKRTGVRQSVKASEPAVLEDTYITEDMLMDLGDRTTRGSGHKESILSSWLAQIPRGYPEVDPLERHQAAMTALMALQKEKQRLDKERRKKSKK